MTTARRESRPHHAGRQSALFADAAARYADRGGATSRTYVAHECVAQESRGVTSPGGNRLLEARARRCDTLEADATQCICEVAMRYRLRWFCVSIGALAWAAFGQLGLPLKAQGKDTPAQEKEAAKAAELTARIARL